MLFWRLKTKIDPSGIFTLISYLAAAFMRVLMASLNVNTLVQAFVEILIQHLLQSVIYFFTFEILKIEATFKAVSIAELNQKIKAINIRRNVFLIFLLGIVAPILIGILCLQLYLNKHYLKHQLLYDWISIVARCIRIILDAYIFYNLFRLITLYIKVKKVLNKVHQPESNGKLDAGDIIAIAFVYLILVLNVLQTIIVQINFFWIHFFGLDKCNGSFFCNYIY